MEYRIQEPSELPDICRQIIASTDKRVFLFSGDLGAGKTTMIKAFCKELKCIDEVSSPTFSLVNHYKTNEDSDIYHFDLYRLKTAEEAMDIGFEEYIDSGDYCLIEWPEIIMNLIFTDYVSIKIRTEGLSRLIKVEKDESGR